MANPTDHFSIQQRRTEIQGLILATEQNRIQMQRAWQNLENLEAVLQSAKKLQDDLAKNRRFAGKLR